MVIFQDIASSFVSFSLSFHQCLSRHCNCQPQISMLNNKTPNQNSLWVYRRLFLFSSLVKCLSLLLHSHIQPLCLIPINLPLSGFSFLLKTIIFPVIISKIRWASACDRYIFINCFVLLYFNFLSFNLWKVERKKYIQQKKTITFVLK